MSKKINFVAMNVILIKFTAKAYLFRMAVDGQEVWFPKSLCSKVDEFDKSNIQNVLIADFNLMQKGYPSGVLTVKNVITAEGGICTVCGAKTMKPNYKYCKEHYGRKKNKRDLEGGFKGNECWKCGGDTINKQFVLCEMCALENSEIDTKNEYDVKSSSYTIIELKEHKCQSCGGTKGKEYPDGKVFCSRCETKLADGFNEWLDDVKRYNVPKVFGSYQHRLYCQKCDHVYYVDDNSYRSGLRCDICNNELVDY